MELNPLYFNTSEGGLSPVTTPDSLSPAIIPALSTQRNRLDNRNFFLLDSAAHLLIPTTYSNVSELMVGVTDSADLMYKVVSYDVPNDSYYFASPAEPTDFIKGICLGIANINATDYVVIQTNGLITPVVCSGYTQSFDFPTDQSIYYLGEAGAIEEAGLIQVTNQNTINIKAMEPLTKQAITAGGLVSSAGLTVSAQAGTVVTIGDGVTTHTYSYPTQTIIATVPASSTTHLYLLPDGTVETSSKAYMVVADETSVELEKILGVVTTGSKSSNVVVSGSTIKSVATSSWGSCYFSNDPMTDYQYYQFTYGSSVSNTFVGVGAVNTGTVMANFALNSTSGVTQLVYMSLASSSTNFVKPASATLWTLHDSSTIAVGTTKVHRILIDQIRKKVYWSIEGVWLNGGQPLASYTGTDKIVPMFSVANNTVYTTFNTPTIVTLPPGFVESYNYYDKSTNTSYSYPTLTTIDYAPKMYLGKVVSNSTTVTSIASPPLNNTYTEEVYVSELTSINHNLFAHNPIVTVNQERGITYTLSSDPQTAFVSTNGTPQSNTIVTVTI